MKVDKLEKLLNELLKQNQLMDNWIDSVPTEIRSSFFDNPFVNKKDSQIQLLIEFIFDDLKLTYTIEYFLYNPFPQNIKIIDPNERNYTINDTKDFINYLIAEKLIEKE